MRADDTVTREVRRILKLVTSRADTSARRKRTIPPADYVNKARAAQKEDSPGWCSDQNEAYLADSTLNQMMTNLRRILEHLKVAVLPFGAFVTAETLPPRRPENKRCRSPKRRTLLLRSA